MTVQYNRFNPGVQANRNSAIQSPRQGQAQAARSVASAPDRPTSAMRRSMNIPAPLAPRGHRQAPFGGRTGRRMPQPRIGNPTAPNPGLLPPERGTRSIATPTPRVPRQRVPESPFNPNAGRSPVSVPEGPAIPAPNRAAVDDRRQELIRQVQESNPALRQGSVEDYRSQSPVEAERAAREDMMRAADLDGGSALIRQLQRANEIQNRGGFQPMPFRGNRQGRVPPSIYRPQQAMRY